MSHFLVFGTHPRLSLAEYRACRPNLQEAPRLMAHGAVVNDPDWDDAALMQQLGGTVKLGEIILSCEASELTAERLAELCAERPRGTDVDFGFSVIGGTPGVKRTLEKLPLHLKRALRDQGIKSRWVTSKDSSSLSPAAVAKLKLTTDGYDFVAFADGQTVHLGLTTQVQNADAWSDRDYGRPVRDDQNGMLPPKLARMIVNLSQVQPEQTLLDPFCGSGTILMEAALATEAAHIIGSDVEDRQVLSTEKNTDWLVEHEMLTHMDRERIRTFTSDVTKVGEHLALAQVDRVATEGDLGRRCVDMKHEKQLDKNRDDITELWRKTLRSLHPLLSANAKLVACWPSFKTSHGLSRVKLDDELEALGFRLVNPLAGWDETGAPLVYHREGQKVARRIVVLEKV